MAGELALTLPGSCEALPFQTETDPGLAFSLALLSFVKVQQYRLDCGLRSWNTEMDCKEAWLRSPATMWMPHTIIYSTFVHSEFEKVHSLPRCNIPHARV